MIALELLAGWLIADLLSGLGHWIGDSYLLERLGLEKLFAGANVDHHARPLDIVHQGVLKRNATAWAGTVLFVSLWLLLLSPSWVLAGAAAGGLIVSEVHRWAHSPSRAPRAVRWLQKTGLLQSPRHHAAHHRPPHSVRFCLLTNWLNLALDSLRRLR